jgi:hypoxanthine phosphoribosyltransferase
MPELFPVLSKEDINRMISALAKEISADYEGRTLILIGVLKGAFIFLADLIRKLTIPVEVDFLRISSYESRTSSSEKIKLTKKIENDLQGKDVLIVEDIIDTGLTIEYLIQYVKSLNPLSVGVCTLIDKVERRRRGVKINYTAHKVLKGFFVGYGLDYAENYRNLPEIYDLKL